MNDKDKRAEELFKDSINESSSIATGAVDFLDREGQTDLVAKMNPVPPPKPSDTDQK